MKRFGTLALMAIIAICTYKMGQECPQPTQEEPARESELECERIVIEEAPRPEVKIVRPEEKTERIQLECGEVGEAEHQISGIRYTVTTVDGDGARHIRRIGILDGDYGEDLDLSFLPAKGCDP